jgi:hypothetical protein
MPDEATLMAMSEANSDGRGVMFPMEGRVVGAKCQTLKELVGIVAKIPKGKPVVFHFRLATHGEKGMEGAHPFPFPVVKVEEMFAPKFLAPIGVMHNGVISGFGDRGNTYVQRGKWNMKAQKWEDDPEEKKAELKLSDTQAYLWYLAKDKDIAYRVGHLDRATLKIIGKWTGNKWAFMHGNGRVRLLGEFEVVDGLSVSNTYWQWRYEEEIHFTGAGKKRGAYIWKKKAQRTGAALWEREELTLGEAHTLIGQGIKVGTIDARAPKVEGKRDWVWGEKRESFGGGIYYGFGNQCGKSAEETEKQGSCKADTNWKNWKREESGEKGTPAVDSKSGVQLLGCGDEGMYGGQLEG